ncbi:hypothetical protein [Micromonospora sp. NPDC007220]
MQQDDEMAAENTTPDRMTDAEIRQLARLLARSSRTTIMDSRS